MINYDLMFNFEKKIKNYGLFCSCTSQYHDLGLRLLFCLDDCNFQFGSSMHNCSDNSFSILQLIKWVAKTVWENVVST